MTLRSQMLEAVFCVGLAKLFYVTFED